MSRPTVEPPTLGDQDIHGLFRFFKWLLWRFVPALLVVFLVVGVIGAVIING